MKLSHHYFRACRKGYDDIVEILLRAGASVDAVGMYSWTPLLVATRGNFIAVVEKLLEKSPNINTVDKDGLTALAISCKEGFTVSWRVCISVFIIRQRAKRAASLEYLLGH